MIYFLDGNIVKKELTYAVIEVGGIGYEVFITLGGYESLPPAGEKARLYTYHHVREDAQLLYGFTGEKERDFFKLLIGVSGVGPKVAMGVLGAIRLPQLREAIFAEDPARLYSLPGIGKKTAERIVLELKGKVTPTAGETAEAVPANLPDQDFWNEALLALISLGYNQGTAQKALKRTLQKHENIQSAEELVRRSLSYV